MNPILDSRRTRGATGAALLSLLSLLLLILASAPGTPPAGAYPAVAPGGPLGNAVVLLPATATAGSATWITIRSPFTDDDNGNSYTTYEYALSPSGPWTVIPTGGSGLAGDSSWRLWIATGLTPNTDYYLRVT